MFSRSAVISNVMNPRSLLSLGPVKSSTFFSMIRETCSRTGTLLSLKAVVMKQPKVSAAITLSEKANSEFARDRTVFIATTSPRGRTPVSDSRSPGSASCGRPSTPVPPTPRTRCARSRSARRRPTPFPALRLERARSHSLGHTHPAAGHARWRGRCPRSVRQSVVSTGVGCGHERPALQGSLLPGFRPGLAGCSRLKLCLRLCFAGLRLLSYTCCDIHFQDAWS